VGVLKSSLAFLIDLEAALSGVVEGEPAVATALRILAGRLDADDCAYDEMDDPQGNAALSTHHPASAGGVAIPVLRNDRVEAVLTLDRRGEHAWQREEIELATLVAHRCHESLARARAVREAKERAAHIRLVADNLPAKIGYVDCDLRYRFNNAAYADWYGMPLSAIVGRHVKEILGDETYDERLPYMERALAGETVTFESRSEHSRLGVRMTDITCVPDVDASGDVQGFFVMSVDTTERKRAEEQLRENDRRKDEFLAMLAHELRNPLAPLANALYLWPRVEHDAAKLAELRHMMERQIGQLRRLIDDLLDVSRISRGRIELRRAAISLGDVLHDAVDAIRPQVEQHGQQLVVDDETLMNVSGDAARLTQVFGNVLNNASKYTQDGGTIRVVARREGAEAVVQVIDNGRGIPPQMLDHVFDMFVQVEPTLESREGGLGIGLALSRRLTELHGGRIEARSAGTGCGTEVVVRLPIIDEGDAPVADTPRRILIVDQLEPRDERLQ
jgi:PAS domain S-box-containing protein